MSVAIRMPRRRKVKFGAKRAPAPGLCETCQTAEQCSYPRNSTEPVLHCLEFVPAPPRADDARQAALKPVTPEASDAGQEVPGLCRTCDRRAVCTFPRPEGGIWHCEEYL